MHVDGVDGPRFLVGIVIVMVAARRDRHPHPARRAGRARPGAGRPGGRLHVRDLGHGRQRHRRRATRSAIVGAGLFYVSDALIAWNRFVAETRHGRVAIMVTYHLAQVGLVLSLV